MGFVRAGHTTPTGRGHGEIAKDGNDEWEQLPAYTPPEEGQWQPMRRVEEGRTDGLDDWIVEPPELQPSQERERDVGVEPPAYW